MNVTEKSTLPTATPLLTTFYFSDFNITENVSLLHTLNKGRLLNKLENIEIITISENTGYVMMMYSDSLVSNCLYM